MPKHDFIFVDESGDPGYTHDENGRLLSSSYYTAAALHLCDDSFGYINSHIATFRYYTGYRKELKLPPEQEVFSRLVEPISVIAESDQNVWASVVYLDKPAYTGRYLKPGGQRPQDTVRFRNYILRCLLEHHFQNHPLQSQQYGLVLDRIDMTDEEISALKSYLKGNYNIPTPTHITHASSIYVEGLQVVHHIASGFKNVALGSEIPKAQTFVTARDITSNQYIFP